MCDFCQETVLTASNGYVIEGNLYIYPTGGIIGNNFPDSVNGYIPRADVQKTEICRDCLLKQLETGR